MYADIIIDISHEKVDKTFQYHIPDEMLGSLTIGCQVEVPFGKGNKPITGYIVDITEDSAYDPDKIKDVLGKVSGSVAIESELIALAAWIKRNYGSTMNRALKTVIPVHKEEKQLKKRTVLLAVERDVAADALVTYTRKRATAKKRLLESLMDEGSIDYDVIIHKLNITSTVIKSVVTDGLIKIKEEDIYRVPVSAVEIDKNRVQLNDEQQLVVDEINEDFNAGENGNYLIHGITGSGKTEVYLRLIENAVNQGKQAIVLIPEIALTFQTVMRFTKRFGNRVSILHSRLSAGERYDQFLRAKRGELDVMIGPRSALFTPFDKLGFIIIDEEHEGAYKSETAPKYQAREVAMERARMQGASVILGSATPSLDTYYGVKQGKIKLYELTKRAGGADNASCEVIDLRQELRNGNKSIISRRLDELIRDRLDNHEQIMLFLNRRGMSGFISCRECGKVIKCPHCDVSLSLHRDGKMKCHYCGYETLAVNNCPSCGSKYIGGFKAGTQKVEELLKKEYPAARILRMDYDNTRTKDSYENILSTFANEEADILIGTQMIVKGHDFPKVTLVGILAADISLGVGDYMAAERTFSLLTQAEGRAGRGSRPGIAILQTYQPDHYAVEFASCQDYKGFYEREIEYRRMMYYPPVWNMLKVDFACANEEEARVASEYVGDKVRERLLHCEEAVTIGPAEASVAKVNDMYQKVLYIKSSEHELLVEIKDMIENLLRDDKRFSHTLTSFDFT